jgi:HSP20 family protein
VYVAKPRAQIEEAAMSYPVRRPWWRAPQQQHWDPFNELVSLRGEMARVLRALSGARGAGEWFGDVDVDEDEDEQGWTVTARLPGVAPDEVVVEVEDRDLCIRARSEAEERGQGQTVSRHAAFNYRLTLPSDADTDQVDATMDHGLLTVRMPRSERSRRREITVGRGKAGQQPPATGQPPAERGGGASAPDTSGPPSGPGRTGSGSSGSGTSDSPT